MLNNEQIKRRLSVGEIFAPETWAEANLATASYDLRIASDFLITPDEVRHQVGQPVRVIDIEPGEIALVSTMERFRLPWDIVGNMSAKFSLAKQGILVHTGSVVDPGFGLRRDGQDGWSPREDERVHFFLANVGKESVHLRPGDTVATIQFAQITPPPPQTRKEISSRAKIEAELFTSKGSLSLAYFAWLKVQEQEEKAIDAELREEVDRLRRETKTQLALVNAKFGELKAGYQQLTFFGIYVLAAALLTIFGTLIFQGRAADELIINQSAPWVRVLAGGTFIGLLIFPALLIYMLWKRDRAKEG